MCVSACSSFNFALLLLKINQQVSGMEYLITLEKFRELMVRQMETSAAEELAAKINTRKLEASNQKLLSKIKG